MIIPENKTVKVLSESVTESGVTTKDFSIENDTIIITLAVSSISGTLDITVDTIDGEGNSLEVISFPQLSSTTSELILKKAATCLHSLRINATYSDACAYTIYVKGTNAGESSTKILGVGNINITRVNVDTSTAPATTLIASALNDRSGLIIKNTDSINIVDINTVNTTTFGEGYPLSPGEAISMDIDSGISLYGVSNAGTVSIAIIEGGA